MSLYGLIGYPLEHSFSQQYFTEKFRREGITAAYSNFELADLSQLGELMSSNPALKGFNVTIPYKSAIIPLLEDVDETAAAIGAVNVVKILPDGTTVGHNTDVDGFVSSLRPFLRDKDISQALVLGTGGAAKAVTYGLRKLSIRPLSVSRTPQKGDLTYADLTPQLVSEYRLIVNTTPLGMYPSVDEAPDIPYSAVSSGHICYDLIYNPAETLFLKKCAEHGATTINGLDMLHRQAEAAWDIWMRP